MVLNRDTNYNTQVHAIHLPPQHIMFISHFILQLSQR